MILMNMLVLNNAIAENQAESESSAFQFSADYTGDLLSNFRGGIKPGTNYLGLANINLSFYTQHAGLWHGGEFLLHASNTHGGEPSANLIGDFQVASNIEAGNHTFLYELWYKHSFQNFKVTIGLQDMNTEFANSDAATLYLNSSFGIHSVIADNIQAPIFPITSPGITICYQPVQYLILKSAFYQGCPIDFSDNPYNINWNLTNQQGLLWITEIQLNGHKKNNRNEFKLGSFYHRHCEDAYVENSASGEQLSYDYGFYMVGDHQITKSNFKRHQLKFFYQLGLSPRNDNSAYIGSGCSCTGLISKDGKDELGLAMAWGIFSPKEKYDEIAIELSYKYELANNIYLQPDVQYIIHPGGTNMFLKNATVGIIRFGVEF